MAKKERKRATLTRGNDAMSRLKEEQKKSEERRAAAANRGPMRFYVKKAEGGSGYQEHEIIILDDDIEQAPMGYEHEVPGPGGDYRSKREVMCIDETDDCPICRAAENGIDQDRFKPARYNMYLTVIDTTPYTIKNGRRAGETVSHSKMLYVVPQGQIASLLKVAAACKKQNGTTRGMVLAVTKSQQTDARCGVPQPMDNGMLFDFCEEDELEEDFWNEEVKVDGKVVKEAGSDIEPYDYETDLEVMDAKEMRAAFSLPAPPGSDDEEEESTGSRRRRRRKVADADEAGKTSGRRRRRRRDEEEDDEESEDDQRDDEEEEDDEEEPPKRRRRASKGGGRTSRRRRDEEEDDEGDEEETPKRRRRRKAGDGEIPF